MKPYGSKRSFDTEPRIKSARALVKREGEALIEEQAGAAPVESPPRCSCGKLATWSYDPGAWHKCDECVPRGCSCQDDESEPCIEWSDIGGTP